MTYTPPRPPLVVIGLDAGDPHQIRKWADEGHLPAIKSILDRGCHAITSGPELVSEHGVWVSIFSGLSRGAHGYYYVRQLSPGKYDLREATGAELDAPPFWGVPEAAGLKVLTVDVPDMPPVPGVDGVQLFNWAVHLGWLSKNPTHQPKSIPPEFLEQADRRFGPRDVILESSVATPEQDRGLFQRLCAQADRRGELLRATVAEASDGFDLIVTVFAESHTAGHQFWKYRPGAKGLDGVPNSPLEHAIRDVYVRIDKQLGLLLETLPADANVVLCSTVGISDYQPSGDIAENFLRLLGLQVSPPPQAKSVSFRPLDIARKLLPESVRIALSKNLSREARERLMADAWRGRTDWGRTKAFAVPGTYTSFIQVNLRGRESNGIVSPGDEYDCLLDEIEAELSNLVDPVTGESPVELVSRSTRVFGLSEPPRSLPDLFVIWKSSKHFLEKVVHPKGELLQKRPEWYRPSDHYRHGFFAACGPDVGAAGDLGSVDVLDLAPTLLALLGRSPAAQMTGTKLPILKTDAVPV
jgi:predicted AlkP superfamily phosphohydrolase/phosphomutase